MYKKSTMGKMSEGQITRNGALMPLADLSYRNTDIRIMLTDFANRFQKLTQLYAECQPCKKKAMEMGIQLTDAEAAGSNLEGFNLKDKLLDLQIECKQLLLKIDDVKKQLQDINDSIVERIKYEQDKL